MLINFSKIMILCAILCAPPALTVVAAEDIVSYAKTCNAKVAVEVKGFNCLKVGPMATGEVATPYLDGTHAFWMKPGLNAPAPASKEASRKISECAQGIKIPDCVLTPWGGQLAAVIESQRGQPLPALSQPAAREKPKPHEKQ